MIDWALDKAVIEHKLATVKIGPRYLFVINNYELAKDLFGREEFSGRHVNDFIKEHKAIGKKPRGIIITEGEHWMKQRRFSLRTLKDLGVGKQCLEDVMYAEIDILLKTFLETSEDKCIDADFNAPVINILWQLVTGNRFEEMNKEGLTMLEAVNTIFRDAGKMALVPLCIHKIFPKLTNYAENVKLFEYQKSVFFKQIDDHEKSRDLNNPRDFIDMYLNELENDKEQKNFTKEDLALIMMDFLHAGTETSSTTLKWIVLYLGLYPSIQER